MGRIMVRHMCVCGGGGGGAEEEERVITTFEQFMPFKCLLY